MLTFFSTVKSVQPKLETDAFDRGICKESGYPAEIVSVATQMPGPEGYFGSSKGRLAHFDPKSGLMDQFQFCPTEGGSNMKEWALFKYVASSSSMNGSNGLY